MTTWAFEGQIRVEGDSTVFSPGLVALGIDVGAPISGHFEMDETVADSNAETDVYGLIWGVMRATSPDIPDMQFAFFEMVATDPGVIVGDAFPVSPPDLVNLAAFDELFPFPWLTSFGFATESNGVVRAEISSVQVIPERTTALLVSLGLAGMAASRRRR